MNNGLQGKGNAFCSNRKVLFLKQNVDNVNIIKQDMFVTHYAHTRAPLGAIQGKIVHVMLRFVDRRTDRQID